MDILGTEVLALLDSGAAALDIVEPHGFKFFKSNKKICTADYSEHTCLGNVSVPYSLKVETIVIPALIEPKIRKPLLGMEI